MPSAGLSSCSGGHEGERLVGAGVESPDDHPAAPGRRRAPGGRPRPARRSTGPPRGRGSRTRCGTGRRPRPAPRPPRRRIRGSPTLASSGMAWPSRVRAVTVEGRDRRGRAGPRRAAPRTGSQTSSPVEPSTSSTVPPGADQAPRAATTAGIPSERARIAVCEVGPPSSVTRARQTRGIEQRGVGRREIVGDEHERLRALRHARGRATEERGDDPRANVVQVGDALRHPSALSVECLGTSAEHLPDRAFGARALHQHPLAGLLEQAGVVGECGTRLEDAARRDPRLGRRVRAARRRPRRPPGRSASTRRPALPGVSRRSADGSSIGSGMRTTAPAARPGLTPIGAAGAGVGSAEASRAVGAGSSDSPKPSATSAPICSSAAAASAPVAANRSVSPWRPPTASSAVGPVTAAGRPTPGRSTVTVASRPARAPTRSAAGRACMPSRLSSTTSAVSWSAAASGVDTGAAVCRLAELALLREQGAARLAVDLVEGRATGRTDDAREQSLDERRARQPHLELAIRDELERHLGAQHRRAEVHEHQHAVGGGHLGDRLGDAHRIRPRPSVAGARRDRDPRRRVRHHLERERDGGFGKTGTVRHHDDADHGHPSGVVVARASVRASNSSAVEVAPGSR